VSSSFTINHSATAKPGVNPAFSFQLARRQSTAPQRGRFGALPNTESMGSFGTGRAQNQPNRLTLNAINMAPSLQSVCAVTTMRSASPALGDEFVKGCRSNAGLALRMGVTHSVL
jgi:hypothetical protein